MTLQSNSFIYSLVDPITLEVRYIGQTTCGYQRYKDHCKISENDGDSYRANWLRSLIKKDLKPILSVLKYTDDLDYWEKYFISVFANSGAKLVNAESGGRSNFTFRQETKDKIAATLRDNHKDYKYKLRHSRVRGGKPVLVYNLYGDFIGEYSFATEAADTIGIGRPQMSNILNGSKSSCNGYTALYKDEYSTTALSTKLRSVRRKPIIVIDMDTRSFFRYANCNSFINYINNTPNKKNDYGSYSTYGIQLFKDRYIVINYTAWRYGDNEFKINNIKGKLIDYIGIESYKTLLSNIHSIKGGV
jgi:hypothetical protein